MRGAALERKVARASSSGRDFLKRHSDKGKLCRDLKRAKRLVGGQPVRLPNHSRPNSTVNAVFEPRSRQGGEVRWRLVSRSSGNCLALRSADQIVGCVSRRSISEVCEDRATDRRSAALHDGAVHLLFTGCRNIDDGGVS